ncbi:hypothetical protein BDA99DRAFT_575533, partial [Phascolomyces articulosus]
MYIEYETAQVTKSKRGYVIKEKNPSKRVPDMLPRTDFMPTKLIRTSDMKVVYGSEVHEGYCALSYSWNQSGRILKHTVTGEIKRIDKAKHRIIYPKGDSLNLSISEGDDEESDEGEGKGKPSHKIIHTLRSFKNGFLSKESKYYQQEEYQLDYLGEVGQDYMQPNYIDNSDLGDFLGKLVQEDYYSNTGVKYVKFESILQRICQQFNISYIWYDQMCINQNNKREKQREIRNMHHIYNNAYCTVALVPEFHLEHYDINDEYLYDNYHKKAYEEFVNAENSLQNHQYFKRLWTLEEAIKAKRILFVGKNIHCWGEDLTRQ